MILAFRTALRVNGNRYYAPIPLNMWERTGLKGNIPSSVCIQENSFECKLVPKGGGFYWIPVGKVIASALPQEKEFDVTLELIPSLSRINHNSPYSRENPVRKIDRIQTIPIQPGFCGHCCVAMLAGVGLADVVSLMGKSHASWSKILEALDYYGIAYAEKAVYPRKEAVRFPQCCIVYNDSSFLLWYKGAFCGATDIDLSKTTCYLEIVLP
ncbi:DUF1905 domain-containing protein [Caproiciproducens faecalis]|uniref:DUF1905 domain-containing protein n=1 Tax=Caproiciproducens faecalis TaxID=2820301 RepID=A0ABS7DKZ8_9FIRM|nr:DUF1905 domain-containing protein [Caproiciproducens faecalis]MBW7571898.1 DUF1905 domain-containing protein [Caproiciproducens faecalis]